MAKESRSEYTANCVMALAPARDRAYDVLVANGFKVGHNFVRPVKQNPTTRKVIKNKSFFSRFF